MNRASLDLTEILRKPTDYQLGLLLNQLVCVSIASCIAAGVVVNILWAVADQEWLLLWMASILVISLFRILLVFLYKLREQPILEVKSWRAISVGLIFLVASIWGSLAWIYDFNWPVLQQFAVIALLTMASLGAIPAYAASMFVYSTVILLMLGPAIYVFISVGNDEYTSYGILLLGLIVLLLYKANQYHKNVIHVVGSHLKFRQDYSAIIHAHERLKSSHSVLNTVFESRETEEEIAHDVYTRIARIKSIDEKGIKGRVEPAGYFSGDFIYKAQSKNNETYIFFADFSGHGLPAALGAIPISTVFHCLVAEDKTPEDIIKAINVDLVAKLPIAQFCCACFIVLNKDKTQMQVWNAGMPDVFVVREAQQSIDSYSSVAMPLGIAIDEGSIFFETIELAKGDLAFFHTDGLTEAWSDIKKAFGNNKLKELLLEHHQDTKLLDVLMQAVVEHCGTGKLQEDDISMLEIRG